VALPETLGWRQIGSVIDMSKIRILFFNVAILGLMVAGGLQANTMTTYSGNPYNINMDLSPSYNYSYNSNIVSPSSYDIINNNNTTTYAYSNYGMSAFQNNNLCVMGFCGSSYTNFDNNSVPPTIAGIPNTVIDNLQPPDPPLTVLPIETTLTLPDLVMQPSNLSTVTTNIPTIQVTTNFNSMPIGFGDFANPEPSTVPLLVSGMAALGILHRKRLKNRPH
jgi:hypothetical protein